MGPKLAIGDGALGFWKALAKIYGNTQQQRCWVHKTGNVLNNLPKAAQPKAKTALQQIWMAETRENAYRAFDEFIATYQLKFPKATSCLAKDRTELLAFYDYPAEHWPHLRTTNPIESTFATVKLRRKGDSLLCHQFFRSGEGKRGRENGGQSRLSPATNFFSPFFFPAGPAVDRIGANMRAAEWAS